MSDPRLLAAIGGSLLYPFVVFLGLPYLPAALLVGLAIALAGLRLLAVRRTRAGRGAMLAFVGLSCILAALLLIDPQLAAKAYPTIVSLLVAALFAGSLLWPPSLIERIARRREPDLDGNGIAYTRKLTWIWLVMLLVNALVSAILAQWGSLAAWTLWTGLLSYLLMGALFAGEWLLRRHVVRPHAKVGDR